MKRMLNILKAISSLNFRTLYYLILKASLKELPKVDVIKTKKGTFCGFKNDYLFQQAIKNGINEDHFVSVASCLLSSNNVAIDLGGNIGTHSIVMSKLVGTGTIFTFEPQSLVFSILQNNLLLNNCNNVVTYRFACSDSDFKTISMQPFSFSGKKINNGALRIDTNYFSGDLALTRTLDSFNFKRLDFIKMDIQGSEVKALRGAKKTINNHRPYMFIEIEEKHLNAMNTSTKELIEVILSFNYCLYRIENNYPCDHICVPLEKIEEFEIKIKHNLNLNLSKKISGKFVEVSFKNLKDQNYKSIKIL